MDDKALIDTLLGYLNFSDGTPNAAFQKSMDQLFRLALNENIPTPHAWVLQRLEEQLQTRSGSSAAYQDIEQAQGVLVLVRNYVLPGYREHHRDLLAHLSDEALFQPFFLARVFEATLAQHGPWSHRDRIVSGTLTMLNDYVGFRPVAVLEGERKLQPYPHERVRPIPVYLKGVGVAVGPYELLIEQMLEVLGQTDPMLLGDACLDLSLLDELALDPRAYDHIHPANSRPGYQFGEWDPHHLDNKGNYRRLVLRPNILQALSLWLAEQTQQSDADEQTLRLEAAVALAGTVILASGISGDRPETHNSETSLATVVPRIARCRDAFYDHVSRLVLKKAIPKGKQPFAQVRHFLNRHIARERAIQVQHDRLAQLYAQIGDAEESRNYASGIECPSLRLRSEMQILLTAGHMYALRLDARGGATVLPQIRGLLTRAIECGAMVDPWNILGFQGNFSVFRALQDSVVDLRVDQLLLLMQQIFDLHARLLKVAAAQGDTDTQQQLEGSVKTLADWWDRFASFEVSDVRRVCGHELASSCLFVARVLSLWRKSGSSAGNVAFWNKHSKEFTTPQAYELVLEALFETGDLLTTRALLMHWLSQSETVPLEDGDSSFFDLMIRWMNRCAELAQQSAANADNAATLPAGQDPESLVGKLFEYLEVNAGAYWRAPTLLDESEFANEAGPGEPSEREGDEMFSAAYEGMTFRDSANDGQEGDLAEGGGSFDEDPLSMQAFELRQRLAFLDMRAKLEQIAATMPWKSREQHHQLCEQWGKHASATRQQLLKLLDSLNAHQITGPLASQDSIMEFDRQHSTKIELMHAAIETAVETAHAQRHLRATAPTSQAFEGQFDWEESAIELHAALRKGDVQAAKTRLEEFQKQLEEAPLLYVPLDKGGSPRILFESRFVRDFLKQVVRDLPRLGLFRETFQLMEATQRIEHDQAGVRQQITEFNLFFPAGYTAVVENLVLNLAQWPGQEDDEIAATWTSPLVERFSKLWIEHSSSVQFGELDRVVDQKSWRRLGKFIRTYGHALFTQGFMTYGNLRGILRQGATEFLTQLEQESDPYQPNNLVEDLADHRLDLSEAGRQLSLILRVVLEHYDVYRDYNSTTMQSDYGENLHLLLEHLRVLHAYERYRWGLEPAYVAHGILARAGRLGVAAYLEQAFVAETHQTASDFVDKLKVVEAKCGFCLASVEDRISERLVRPLRLNRLLAMLEPSIKAIAKGDSKNPVLETLRQLIEEFTQSAPGAGLDLPQWLVEVEEEVHRLLDTSKGEEQPQIAPIPWRALSHADYQKQLENWERDDPTGRD